MMMKKIIFSILLSMCICDIQAQVSVDDSLRYDIKQYLIQHNDANAPEYYDERQVYIRNLVSNKLVENGETLNDVGIYSIKSLTPIHAYLHILISHHSNLYLINMRANYPDILTDLVAVFKQNIDIDDRLLPYFNYIIYQTFLRNTTNAEKGRWRDFWEQKDSLSQALGVDSNKWIQ